MFSNRLFDFVKGLKHENEIWYSKSDRSLLAIINEEIKCKSEFVDNCRECKNLRNSYWQAYVHGLKFVKDVIENKG